jgi:hypothetical protein
MVRTDSSDTWDGSDRFALIQSVFAHAVLVAQENLYIAHMYKYNKITQRRQ